jgi:hypothetical protein
MMQLSDRALAMTWSAIGCHAESPSTRIARLRESKDNIAKADSMGKSPDREREIGCEKKQS